MGALPHRRQVLLFLVAVLFPSAVLVALGLRIIGQERELAVRRLADDRRRLVTEVRQDLLGHLETIQFAELRALAAGETTRKGRLSGHPAVQLVAAVADGRVVLPWDADARVQRARLLLAEPGFARAIARGERAELLRRDLGVAIDAYRAAVRGARDPLQVSYGRLLLARTLKAAGRDVEARRLYRSLLALAPDVVDDHGIPLALYAGSALIEAGTDHELVRRRLRDEVGAPGWHTPPAAYLLRDLIRASSARGPDSALAIEDRPILGQLEHELTLLTRGIALQQELPALGLRHGDARLAGEPSPWVPFADGEWLVTVTAVPGQRSEALIAVATRAALQAVRDARFPLSQPATDFEFRVGGDAPGEALGATFPGLKVVFAEAAEQVLPEVAGLQRALSIGTLILVLSITLFGGYLLWRDVRREVRLAELRSHFVSSVSHELKTPLTAIRMFAETLRERELPDPAARADYLDTIVGESERLTRLLNNVLDHSKIEQDRKLYRREPVSLAEIVQRAASAMEYPLTQGGFTLTVETENGVPSVSADADAVEQAILNLLTNAMKYSGESRDIDLRLRAANGHAVIEVTDGGVGIPDSEQGRLAEKFYRVRSPENDRIPGTGLGLTLVDHMVRAHGGRLEVRSAVGAGSTFAIHLPLGDDS